MANVFHVIELVHRDDHAAAKHCAPGAEAELRMVTVKLIAASGKNARRVALARYPDYVVRRQTTRPTDSSADRTE